MIIPDTNGVVLHLTGELDIAAAPQLLSAVEDQMSRNRVHLYLDLGGLVFCDVVGFAAIGTAHRRLAAAGGFLVVRRPNAYIRQLATWCGMQDVVASADPGHPRH